MGLQKGMVHAGQFVKGQSGNPMGRPKGTKNKWSTEVKKMIKRATGIHFKNLEKDLEAMSPKDRWTVITQISKYVMTTAQKQKNTIKGNVNVQVNYQTKPFELQNPLASLEDKTDDYYEEEDDTLNDEES